MAGSHPKWCKRHPACRLKLNSSYYVKKFESLWQATWSPAEVKTLRQIITTAMLPKEING